ncbi:MAG: hypothetical protein KGJ62_05850 [Armatimonadetes bacterium]|nr:hypothetical protein [Armatimonadota bacterium]MDE2206018.1 hypothetical protein [Armatimonadota bacterium]
MATTKRPPRARRRRRPGISTTRILDTAFELHRSELRWLAPAVAVFYVPAMVASNLITAYGITPIQHQFAQGGLNDAGRLTRFIADVFLAGSPNGLFPGLINWAALTMAMVPVTIGIVQKLNLQEVDLTHVLKRSSVSLPASALAATLGLFVTASAACATAFVTAACATAFVTVVLGVMAPVSHRPAPALVTVFVVPFYFVWIVTTVWAAAWIYTTLFAFLPAIMAVEHPRKPIDLGRNERISQQAGRYAATATVAIAILISLLIQVLLLSAIHSLAQLLGWSGSSLMALSGFADLGVALLVQPYWLLATALIYIETRRIREGWQLMPGEADAPVSVMFAGATSSQDSAA